MATTDDKVGRGPLIILSGPSGSGKSTVIRHLLSAGDVPLRLSVSATTRPPRVGEQDGVHYSFWTRERFQKAVAAGAFLEWAEVHGALYGTLKAEVDRHRDAGFGVILDIDVQGARQIRQQSPDCVLVFLSAASLDTYEQRLRARGTETEASIQTRLAAARRELACVGEYDHHILNDDLASAVVQLRDLVLGLLRRDSHDG